jgi:hypothetical protein
MIEEGACCGFESIVGVVARLFWCLIFANTCQGGLLFIYPKIELSN